MDYSSTIILRTKDTFLAFWYHFFFSFVIILSVLDAFFLVLSEDPADDVETQSANHKYR